MKETSMCYASATMDSGSILSCTMKMVTLSTGSEFLWPLGQESANYPKAECWMN